MIELIKYEHPELSFSNTVDRLLSPMLGSFNRMGNHFNHHYNGSGATSPEADLFEGPEGFRATISLPGMTKDQVKVELNNSVLTISGERKEESEESSSQSTFMRSFSLPDGVDAGNIEARMKDGLLLLNLPKCKDRKPKAIKVK